MPLRRGGAISSSTVRITCCSSRRARRTSSTSRSRNSLRSSSAESSSAASGLIGPIFGALREARPPSARADLPSGSSGQSAAIASSGRQSSSRSRASVGRLVPRSDFRQLDVERLMAVADRRKPLVGRHTLATEILETRASRAEHLHLSVPQLLKLLRPRTRPSTGATRPPSGAARRRRCRRRSCASAPRQAGVPRRDPRASSPRPRAASQAPGDALRPLLRGPRSRSCGARPQFVAPSAPAERVRLRPRARSRSPRSR